MTFQKKEEPLPIRGRRHHPERSSTLMRFPMRSYGYVHGYMDTHMDTSIDIHMDMSMDIHMEMPIKSKVSKLDGSCT